MSVKRNGSLQRPQAVAADEFLQAAMAHQTWERLQRDMDGLRERMKRALAPVQGHLDVVRELHFSAKEMVDFIRETHLDEDLDAALEWVRQVYERKDEAYATGPHHRKPEPGAQPLVLPVYLDDKLYGSIRVLTDPRLMAGTVLSIAQDAEGVVVDVSMVRLPAEEAEA